MRKIILIVALSITAPTIGFAQVDTGSLVGTIKDSSGAVLPGVTVTATSVDTGMTTAVKNAMGGERSSAVVA